MKQIEVRLTDHGWEAKADFTETLGGWVPTAYTVNADFQMVVNGLESINNGYVVVLG